MENAEELEKQKAKLDNIANAKYFETIKRNGVSFDKTELAIFKAGFFTAMKMIQNSEMQLKKEEKIIMPKGSSINAN